MDPLMLHEAHGDLVYLLRTDRPLSFNSEINGASTKYLIGCDCLFCRLLMLIRDNARAVGDSMRRTTQFGHPPPFSSESTLPRSQRNPGLQQGCCYLMDGSPLPFLH